MKKAFYSFAAAALLALSACGGGKTPATPQPVEAEAEAVDTAFMKANAGDYKSFDGSKVITLNADGTTKTKNMAKEYDHWELVQKGEGIAALLLQRPGIDAPVTEDAMLDTEESALTIKSETFRREKPAKK